MDKELNTAVLRELQAIALARTTDVVGIQSGALVIRDTEGLPENLAPAIASIEKTSAGVKVKFYDKLKALELLGKLGGLFEESPETLSNNLLGAIVDSTKEDLCYDDLPELQQAAAAGNDLVESPQMEAL